MAAKLFPLLTRNDRYWESLPIGILVPVRPGTLPPNDNDSYRYVTLTADDTYNGSNLSSKTTSGTDPNIVIQMVVNNPRSVLHGKKYMMLNSMRGYVVGHDGVDTGDGIVYDTVRPVTSNVLNFVSNVSFIEPSSPTGAFYPINQTQQYFGPDNPQGVTNYPDGIGFDIARVHPVGDRVQPFSQKWHYIMRIY